MTLQVSSIVGITSQDIRSQLGTSGTDLAILVSFVERIQLDMLRTSNWSFLTSNPQRFITQQGVTDYWIGATGSNPAGSVDTGLNLTDLKRLDEDSVFDRSNFNQLTKIVNPPDDPGYAYADGASRTAIPKAYTQDIDTNPYLLRLFPAPNNTNGYQPIPSPAICTTSVAGALANRIYYVTTTFVDSLGNESSPAPSAKVFVPANSVLVVKPPQPGITTSASGVQYNQYKVYASTTLGSEVVQNGGTAISTGVSWTEPNGGLSTGTAAKPSANSLTPLDGYLIEFRYFKARPTGLASGTNLLIPDEYKDVITAGVNWLAFQFLNKQTDAQLWASVYQQGLRNLVRDRNLSPKIDFVRPDGAANTFTRF
jgi:hypothetical protein